MMKAILCAMFFLLNGFILSAQNDSIQARIIIIGDAGSFHKDAQGKDRHYVISAVKKTVPFDEKTTVLYVGDNLYYSGLPDDALRTYDIRRQVLDSQIDIAAGTKAKVYFIPGNHDWNRMKAGGWAAIKREQQYVDKEGVGKNAEFYPKDGCPGPVEVSVNKDIVMILVDTQWWLELYEKPGIESDCGAKTKEEIISQLDDILSRNEGKLILFATHHPFKSYGVHGGYFKLKQHLFPFTEAKPHLYIPLPVLGSIYPITRSVFGTAQDIPHPNYQNMIHDFQSVLKDYSNVVYLSGHEHNLQLIKDSSSYYLISGAGTNKTRVSKNSKHLLYGAQQYGFAVLNVSKNKYVNFNYYTVNGDSVKHTYDSTLLQFSALKKQYTDTDKSVIVMPVQNIVTAAIYPQYDSVGKFHRFLFGDNYRYEWSAPVRLNSFYLNTTNGGYAIKSFGGGKQTATLQLESNKNKNEYVLRSINKNPGKLLPDNFKGTLAERIVKDMVSASQPYAPLAIPDLENAVNVPNAKPVFYYVPNDRAFGLYRSKFSNEAVLLEKRNATVDSIDDTKSTSKIIDRIIDDNDTRIDQKEVLRARMIDMLIGDFDRHIDQWRWGTLDTGKGKLYYAIPRDRDLAFFYSDGLFLKIASFQWLRYLKGFRYNIPDIKWFNYEARDFDRLFLNQLNKNDWQQTAAYVQSKITDSVINNAVNKMPAEVSKNNNIIADKLKSRRQLLADASITYYNFISKKVNVLGSNDNEFFYVSGNRDSLKLDVYKRSKKTSDITSLMYSRVFDPHITKEIRLYGFNGQDIFYVDSQLTSPIKLRVIGGKGKDTFYMKGNINNYVYDLNLEQNFIAQKNHTHDETSSSPTVNDYNVTEYKYNIVRFPRLIVGYNTDDKFIAGAGFLHRTYGFRNEPYATEQKLDAMYAFTGAAYQLKYQGEFNHAFSKYDLLVNSGLYNTALNNFYGFGNETKTAAGKDLDYYKTRYNYIDGNVQVRKRLNTVLTVSAGPYVYHYWNKFKDNDNSVLGKPVLVALDSSTVYSAKTYLGSKASILINNLDNVLLPTRGIKWLTEFTALGGVAGNAKPFTSLTSDMEVHAALTDPAKVVAVLKLGVGHIYSRNYEYFQTMNLGANNYLRGFRKNRFSGETSFYGSLEMQFKLFTSGSYILPGDVGLIAFDDIGRVWVTGEHSNQWHNGFGGGFYYAAYNFALLSASIAFSGEEHVFNFSLGTKFNITY